MTGVRVDEPGAEERPAGTADEVWFVVAGLAQRLR
jgi:hypothetical protein